jgi:pimeloyl-ACP methyl ester carboxylesterase
MGGLPMTTQAFSSSPDVPGRSIVDKRPLFGLVPNKPHQNPAGAVFTEEGYTLAIVEFDDQGVCYDRRQMLALATALETLRGKGSVILVFVHGWTHNGSSGDGNLLAFRRILAQTALDAADRPVLGVFVAWRGLSWYGPSWLPVEEVTFFSRKEAALRVALGSVRELLGRLREFRVDESTKPNTPEPVLVIVGHSFGGLIVYSAVAQSMIEAAATPQGRVVPSFSNLVLLLNPAFEAARYLPVFEQIENVSGFVPNQPPVFVSVTGQNDRATGCAFPIGETLASLGESTRGRRERQALIKTMGHLSWMLTHDLSAPGVHLPASRQPQRGLSKSGRRTNLVTAAEEEWTSSHGAMLRRRPGVPENNPFWNVCATPEVIDGHNGIFGDVFVGFVYDLVATHMARARFTHAEP